MPANKTASAEDQYRPEVDVLRETHAKQALEREREATKAAKSRRPQASAAEPEIKQTEETS